MTAITPSASKPFVHAYSKTCPPPAVNAAAPAADEPVDATRNAPVPPEFFVIAGMAIVIADSACRSDIECECAVVVVGGKEWYDTDAPALVYASASPEESRRWIDRALQYFQLRSDRCSGFYVIRNTAFPHLVRFEASA